MRYFHKFNLFLTSRSKDKFMLNKINFPTAVVILGAAAMALGAYIHISGQTELGAQFLEDRAPQPQTVRERSWRDVSYSPQWTLGEEKTPLVYGPFYGKPDPDGNLYLVDYGDTTVKKISPQGEIVCTCGDGPGQGPGELGNVTDLSFAPGEVWVADASNGRILVFDENCEVQRTVRSTVQPYHLVAGPDDQFVMLSVVRASHLFSLFSADGEPQHSFGQLLEDQDRKSLTMDGWIESDRRDGFVYAGLHAGVLAGYGLSGKARFLVETIDPKPLPKLVRGNDRIWIDRDAAINAQSLSVTAEGIHVLTVIPEGFKKRGAIDTYDLDDGAYLFSRKIPEASNRVLVGDDAFYTLTATTVTRWQPEPAADESTTAG